jgi:hypothetical protein
MQVNLATNTCRTAELPLHQAEGTCRLLPSPKRLMAGYLLGA